MTKEQDGRLYLTLLQRVLLNFEEGNNMAQQARNLSTSYTGVFNLFKEIMFPLELAEFVDDTNKLKLTEKGKAARDLIDRYNKLLEV